MLSPILDVLKAAVGFLVVIGFWLAIQAYARRQSGCARDRDMLDYLLNGCGGCTRGGNCNSSKERARIIN